MTTKLFAVVLLCATSAFAQPPRGRSDDPIQALPKDTIVAIVDGEPISLAALEEYSKTKDRRKLHILNQQLFDFREAMLGLMIGERLLKIEADKVRQTPEEYLAANLKPQAVTDADVDAVLDRQPPPPSIEPAQARIMIRQGLERQKIEDARKRFINQLIRKSKTGAKPSAIYLQPPRLDVRVDSTDPVRGSGRVELVEFSDFECPYCKQFQPVLKEVLADFAGRVKHVWKDLPLPNHQFAIPAAMAARCAKDQGKFWEYHDTLFANQQALAPADLKKHAGAVGLDAQAFNTCLDSGKFRAEVMAARKSAGELAISSTPALLVNGRVLSGLMPKEEYTRIIEAELEAAGN